MTGVFLPISLYLGGAMSYGWRDLLAMAAVGADLLSVALIRFRKAMTPTQVCQIWLSSSCFLALNS